MDHKLRVLVCLDIDKTRAVVNVGGCLTDKSYQALLPIIRRAGSLAQNITVAVDLSSADHIDRGGLELLMQLGGEYLPWDGGGVEISAPAELPQCPAQKALGAGNRVVAA